MDLPDVPRVLSLLNEVCDVALQFFRRVEPEWKASRSYVTEADRKVQARMVAWLELNFPGDGLIAEEDNLRKAPAHGTRYWVIDPIDGTAAFVRGLPVWGIGLALLEAGEPVAGFFAVPVTGDRYWALKGGGAFCNGNRMEVQTPTFLHGESVLLSYSKLHQTDILSPDFPGKVRSLGSTIAHMCYAAAGNCDAALLARVNVWDLAPGLAMLTESGGVLRYIHGGPVQLGDLLNGRPAQSRMICGSPHTVARVESLLRV